MEKTLALSRSLKFSFSDISIESAWIKIMYNTDIINIIFGIALISSEIDQGALEQATGRVLRLRIEGPAEYGYKTK